MAATLTEPFPVQIGAVHATPGALAALRAAHCTLPEADDLPEPVRAYMLKLVLRFGRCDWGETDSDDAELNNGATRDGSRILACYPINPGLPAEEENRLWLIADATPENMEATPRTLTVLLPEDY